MVFRTAALSMRVEAAIGASICKQRLDLGLHPIVKDDILG